MEPIDVNDGQNKGQKKERIPRMPNRPYAYFRDDQFTCLMTHDKDQLSEEDLKPWRDEVEQYLKGPRIVWPPRCFSFEPLQNDAYLPFQEGVEVSKRGFSLLVCDMENVPQDPNVFLDFISDLSNKENFDKSLVDKEFASIRIEGVSPNWLTSGASQAGGTGGPGGWPVPFRGNASRAPYQFRGLITKLDELGLYGDGDGVDVIILDTAPCPHDLVAAYKECKNWHPLIRTLLGPEGKLKLYPASYEENLRMGSTSLNEHDYKMTDHGLFAAGIVHSIVPQATIHLIEVLNPFGVGDLEMLGSGFYKAYYDIYKANLSAGKNRPVVLNCSWMLEPPIVPEQRRNPDLQFEEKVMNMAAKYQEKEEAFALKSICDQFNNIGRQIIAAAGNDGRGNNADRRRAPATRYPAAFLGTFGVGALPKDVKADSKGKYKASSYSNLADIPNFVKRIMTLGGEEGEGKGVLGLYLGEFPSCEAEANCTKWAWWAGTSFATPILSGTVAAVLSKLGPQNSNRDVIEMLAGDRSPQRPLQPGQRARIITPLATYADEDVLEAVQEY